MNALLSAIHPKDIYAGFEPMPEDLTGWGGDHPIFAETVKRAKPKVIIEVGTWKGLSAITMGESARAEGLECALICVDTWLGNEDHLTGFVDSLKPRHGYPTIYYQFLSNVVHHKLQEYIIPLPNTSFNAAAGLAKLGIKADLIYIDGAHDYDSVTSDLKVYTPLLSEGGWMFGHDFFDQRVASAVGVFCEQRGKKYNVEKVDHWFWSISP